MVEKICPTLLKNYTPGQTKITKADEKVLELALGHRVCQNSLGSYLINYYFIAIIAIVLFIILSLDCIEDILLKLLPNKISRFILKIVIFFLVIYVADRLIENWRRHNILCCDDR